ncbi:MAG TPA: SBBP repeat-containing protein [Ktedonobacterales bacterium]|jgi:hypothetical protein
MSRRVRGSVTPALVALGLVLLLAPTLIGAGGMSHLDAAHRGALAASQDAGVASNVGQLPLAFELNAGQAAAPVRFLAHGTGYTLGLTTSQALLALHAPAAATSPQWRVSALLGEAAAQPIAQPATLPALLGVSWLGANPNPVVTGEQPLPGTVNYFTGSDPKQWRTNIPTYQQVRLHDVYPGVDLVYYGNQGRPEYDFVVAPGADPARIALGFSGATQMGLDLQGNLSLALAGGTIAQEKPLVYQTVGGARQTVAGGYTLTSSQRVGFALGAYNSRLPLVIDPSYRFSTYFGGSGYEMSDGGAIAVDASDNVYITGDTFSTDLPTANPEQATNAGSDDVFVSKLNAAGSALVYSTYLGGSDVDASTGIAVDGSGNAYITGYTRSFNFPTTLGASQTLPHGANDAFISKLSAAGNALVYSTFLGGGGDDLGEHIAVDASGNAYVTGATASGDFPIQGAFQASTGGGGSDAFVSKLNAAGTALVYSTYLGGSGADAAVGIAVDASGNAYVVGATASTNFPLQGAFQATNAGGTDDAFISKFNAAGNALVYSSYLGGSGDDAALGIAVDASGNAYLTGFTTSTNFPTNPAGSANGGKDAFVSTLNASGSALVYSSYLGGSGDDTGVGIAVDSQGDAYLVGTTASNDFPLVDPLQSTLRDSAGSAFVVRFDAHDTGGLPVFSTYLGSSSIYADSGLGIAVSAGGYAYVIGATSGTDFPTVNALYPVAPANPNAFVTKIFTSLYPVETPGVFRSSNATFYLHTGNVAPSDLVASFGAGTDVPVVGDWTGKGYDSVGVFRGGKWFLRNSNTTGPADISLTFGAASDLPVVGDWTGKGYDSVGVYRPSNNTFYLRNSNTTGPADITAKFGVSGDLPLAGDWDGNGTDTIGVYRPSLGAFLVRNSNTTGNANLIAYFGAIGDTPVVGDWTGQGKDTIGVYRASTSTFYLRNSITTSAYADLILVYGTTGDRPVVGQWAVPLGGGLPPHHKSPATKQGTAPPPRWRAAAGG